MNESRGCSLVKQPLPMTLGSHQTNGVAVAPSPSNPITQSISDGLPIAIEREDAKIVHVQPNAYPKEFYEPYFSEISKTWHGGASKFQAA